MKKKVSYFYKPDVSSYYYGPGHPMKPLRLKLTHHLLLTYGLYRNLDVIRPHEATDSELESFHAPDYIEFMKKYTPSVEAEVEEQMTKYNVGPQSDCPLFDGLFEFVTTCAGGSLEAAALINGKQSDICVNWSGGLHHAKKGEAAGFCYVNDIVLCILELLKVHQRVLYLDIDIHHGDGVEEAFYTTDRVMTVSFHKYGDFFPGSGDINEFGAQKGKYYSVNYPLKDGLDDDTFKHAFVPVMEKVMQVYQPEAVVMCCGADSIVGDRLGCWNLSLKGHSSAISFMKKFNIPLVLLGGGGYTPKNVARCWAYETALALNTHNEMSDTIPENIYSPYYKPGYKLHLKPDADLVNQNDRSYLDKCTTCIMEQLREIPAVPSVQIQEVPPTILDLDRYRKAIDDLEEKDHIQEKEDLLNRIKDERLREHVAEFYASEKHNEQVSMFQSLPPPKKKYKKGTECGGFLTKDPDIMDTTVDQKPQPDSPPTSSNTPETQMP